MRFAPLGTLWDGTFRTSGLLIDEAATFNIQLSAAEVAELYRIGASGAPIMQ